MKINWDAIATIMAIITSVIAIVISVYTAKRQNKIALFEKRYALYKRCLEFYSIALSYSKDGDNYSIDTHSLLLLEKQLDNDTDEAGYLFNEKVCRILQYGKTLFGNNIKSFHDAKELSKNNHGDILLNIIDNQLEFIEETSKYLQL